MPYQILSYFSLCHLFHSATIQHHEERGFAGTARLLVIAPQKLFPELNQAQPPQPLIRTKAPAPSVLVASARQAELVFLPW